MPKMKFYAIHVGEFELPGSVEEMEKCYPGMKSIKEVFEQHCADFREDPEWLKECCDRLVNAWGLLQDEVNMSVSVEVIHEDSDYNLGG
jgi:hypothetical protein